MTMDFDEKCSPADGLNELLKDLYKEECQKCNRYMIITYVLIGLLTVTMILCGMLLYERTQYDKVVITTTTSTDSSTITNDIEGDNGSIINGNQYNDNATDNNGGDG